MRWLPLTLALLCSSAVAEVPPGKVSPTRERGDSLVIPIRPEGFRLTGNLDLEAAGAGVDGAAARSDGEIPSNGRANAPANERSAWRLGEPIGYYPADRSVSKRF